MKRFLFIIISTLFFLGFPIVIYAVPSPEQVDEAKKESEVVVSGEVKNLKITGSLGNFNLLITDIERSADKITPGDLIPIVFRYIPDNLTETGSSKVVVDNGDIIKIWLNPTGDGKYESAIAGDTLEHIKNSPRQNLFPKINPYDEIYLLIIEVIIVFITIWYVIRLHSIKGYNNVLDIFKSKITIFLLILAFLLGFVLIRRLIGSDICGNC